ncbi:retrovirus-related pol polyprotein from transposon TNT 1-94 [Tanacetum coccineum]
MFSIIYEPVHGIIYKNSKKEKRVMRHSEIHKFCDATLNRVLEGLKSYNNDVKYGYVQRELTNDEVEYLKLFKEEIEVRLKYRNQMRRWEIVERLTSLSLDELIGNLKVQEMIIKKDSKIVKAKVERKSIALKAKKNLVMKSAQLPGVKTKKCPKPPRDKNQRAFVGGSWSDSGEEDDEKIQDETCLVAQAPNEVSGSKANNQQEGIDYDETYAPVARLESIRILLAYACALDFKLFQMDVKSAFLNSFINEEGTCVHEFAKIMHDEFEMSMMGELNFFLGLQIKQMEDGIFFNQSKYIKEMLKKFGLEDSKPMKTPMSSDTKLTKDEECESVDSTKYRGMIGSLLYLTASRPDIMFSVCLCARFQEAPKTSHLEAVKRIF